MVKPTGNGNHDFGMNLTGGGARGSYQAGALRRLMEILKEQGLTGTRNPFQYWTGVSAGAINATFCASGVHNLEETSQNLVKLWSEIRPEDVYRTDFQSLTQNSIKWIRDLTFGPVFQNRLAKSLLDTEPLWSYLKKNLKFENVQKNLDSGLLKGLACSAYSYSSNQTVTFLQSSEDCGWQRHRRYSKREAIQVEHVMASCAIPVLFPAIKIDKEFFADGSFRNTTPISPSIHMGASRILVVGVRGRDEVLEMGKPAEPGLARMAGAILNALFFDTIDIDLERLRHVNELIQATHSGIETSRSTYSTIDYKVIRPSRDVSRMAEQKAKKFPGMIKFLLGGLGPLSESSELASYILFVSDFTKDLIELGYNDVEKHKSELIAWLSEAQV